jgi:hypothetical protein
VTHRIKSVTTSSAVRRSVASIGNIHEGCSLTLGVGDDRQQKPPSSRDGVIVRHVGLEPTENPVISGEKQQLLFTGAAKASVAVCLPVAADDDLRSIVQAWPALPAAIKAGIVAMVRAVGCSMTRGAAAILAESQSFSRF